jgi:two-component system cell cycle sensor histidine kinase/response regulator CckA
VAALPDGVGRLLVLVDDDDAVRRVTATALARDGWEVEACDSGESALAVLRRRTPAMLVSDVLMPEMDGPELARAARALHPGLPVLLVSGYSDTRLPELEGEREIAFLAKPYALAALRGALAALLAGAADSVAAAD